MVTQAVEHGTIRRGAVVAAVVVLIWTRANHAEGPLDAVPADAAAVLVVRSPGATLERFNAVLAKIAPDAKPLEWSAIQKRMGPAGEHCDPDCPLVVVLMRPGWDEDSLVIGSRTNVPPKGLKASDLKPGIIVGGTTEKEGDSECVYLRRGGMTFACQRRRSLRYFSRVRPMTSFSAALDDDERALGDKSDVVLRIRMGAWQERIRPYVAMAGLAAKSGAASQVNESELETRMRTVMFDWAVEGATNVVNQISHLSVGVSIGDDGIHVRHDFRFEPGGSAAEYLSKVKRCNTPPWECLPDRPFIVAMASDWNSDPDAAVMGRMVRMVFEAIDFGGDLSEDQRKTLLASTDECYKRMRGMNMVVSTPPGRMMPMDLVGTYAFDDSAEGLKQLLAIQRSACKAMESFTLGGCSGEGVQRAIDGVKFVETPLCAADMNAAARKQIELFYGVGAAVRQSAVGPNRVLYAISTSPDSFVAAAKSGVKARNLGDNPRVRKVVEALPHDSQIWALVDVRRMIDMAKDAVRIQMGQVAVNAPPSAATPADVAGPILGWAGRTRKAGFSGELYVSVADLAATCRQIRDMTSQIREQYIVNQPQPASAPVPMPHNANR